MQEVTSKHLRHANELLVHVPIKRGLVPIPETLSYASRLRILLRTLYEIDRVLTEREVRASPGAIERLQGIFNSQWAVLPDDRHLLITVSFDRSWEDYFQQLVRYTGPALDAIFCHCEGYERNMCVDADGRPQYRGFPEYIRSHQIQTDFYFAAAPDVTVDDLAYLKRVASERAPSVPVLAQTHIGTATQEIERLQEEAAVRVVAASHPELTESEQLAQATPILQKALQEGATQALKILYDLRAYFPSVAENAANVGPTAQLIFDRAAQNLVPGIDQVQAQESPEFQQWITALNTPAPSPIVPATQLLGADDLEAIQGNILQPYEGMTHGCVVLLRCADADSARAFLGKMSALVTPQSSSNGSGPFTNLALTYSGLERLGLSDDLLRGFPREFRDGMEARAGALGDIGNPNHPDYWQLPHLNWRGPDEELAARNDESPTFTLSSVDFIVTLQTRDVGASHDWLSHPLRERVEQLAALGARILHVQLLQRDDQPNPREHFGFLDGRSNPVPNAAFENYSTTGTAPRDLVPLGEILLGYADVRNEVAAAADPRGDSSVLFGRGTFLVFRKLEQDVGAFNTFAERNATDGSEQAVAVAKEQMMGRLLADGSPLVAPTNTTNNFDYTSDANGQKCPFHAHIRLANPRNAQATVPRIMRRGFSYGSPYSEASDPGAQPSQAERGLMFMAYNASIATQFEVIQRWLNGGNSTGVLSGQNDLVAGAPQPGPFPHWVYAGGDWKALLPPPKPFVSLRWGVYTFVPSVPALRWLALPPGAKADPELVRLGQEVIDSLLSIEVDDESDETARDAWKSVIEEPMNAAKAAVVWAAIRQNYAGVLKTPYGVLVGSRDAATAVLGDRGTRFSVREYWHRLRATTGEHYLALDLERGTFANPTKDAQKHRDYEDRLEAGPGYAELSAVPNAYIRANFNDAGLFAKDTTHDAACRWATEILDDAMNGARGELHLKELAIKVVAQFCKDWFGLPPIDLPAPRPNETPAQASERERAWIAQLAKGITPFVLTSEYSFQPYPNDAISIVVGQATQGVQSLQPLANTDFHEHLSAASAPGIRDALAGALVGFAAPAVGCSVTVLWQWVQSGQLWPLSELWNGNRKRELLQGEVLAALLRTPIPPLLYRTAMPGVTLNGEPIEAGERVIVGLGSAGLDGQPDPDWLFGGDRETSNPHACPARGAATAVITGIAAAVLERANLKLERPFVLSFGASRK